MFPSPQTFREVMGRLAGGVTVVTAIGAEGAPCGFTATAVCSVSLDPPLVLVCVGREGQTLAAIRDSGRFALNFMPSGGLESAIRFAGSGTTKFEEVEWTAAPGGTPVLPDILAWVECEVERAIEAGDHTVFIGLVAEGRVQLPGSAPLVHFAGRFHTVTRLDP